ncbi:MAG: hypothetical protein FWG42_02790 [Clostridiales bacterium]|nr:hypothetical protein [Clostridiales bacterium]
MYFKRRPLIIVVAVAALMTALFTGCESGRADGDSSVPQKTPLLDVSLSTSDPQNQRIQAAQLTNGWRSEDGSAYEADSPHPLQMPKGYDEATLFLSAASGEIALQFSDDYPPLSVSVQRWDARHAGTDSADVWENGEQVAVSANTFNIENDGNDYIYEVHANWEQGYSWYAFRVNAAELIAIPQPRRL